MFMQQFSKIIEICKKAMSQINIGQWNCTMKIVCLVLNKRFMHAAQGIYQEGGDSFSATE